MLDRIFIAYVLFLVLSWFPSSWNTKQPMAACHLISVLLYRLPILMTFSLLFGIFTSISHAAICLEPQQQLHEQRYLQKMTEAYQQFKYQHDMKALMAEAKSSPETFCQRKFVYIPKWNCREFGYIIYRLLHGLQHAIILNRTYITHTFTCHQKLFYQPWLPHYDHITHLLQMANCDWETRLDFNHTRISNKCALYFEKNRVITFYNAGLDPVRIYDLEDLMPYKAIDRVKVFLGVSGKPLQLYARGIHHLL